MSTGPAFGKKNAFAAQTVAAAVAAPSLTTASASVGPVEKSRWPFLSFGLCALFAYIFRLEMQHRTDPVHAHVISARDYVALGGISRHLVMHDHEWWRMLTAPFLHANLPHLLGNCATLLLVSAYLERMLGRGWLMLLFLVGAVGGSVGSMIYQPETMPSVGASGAIMCLATAMVVLSFHIEAGKTANRMRYRALATVVLAFLPTSANSAMQVDYGAHFGGFVAGMAMGFLLLMIWPDERPMPPLRGAAICGAVFGVALAVFSAWQVATRYPFYAAQDAQLVPTAVLAKSDDVPDNPDNYVVRYPRDPFVRLSYGVTLLNQRDYDDAEEQARAGLADREVLSTEFPPVVAQQLDFLLMASLWGEGRTDEAQAMSGEVCPVESKDPLLASGHKYLVKVGACK